MIFWIDSDSVPKTLRPIILKAAVRLNTAAVFVADRELKDIKQFIADDTFRVRQANGDKTLKSKISMVVVAQGTNSADDYIVEKAGEGDLCITHDIPLAGRLLEKKCTVIDDRGGTYNSDNINALLKNREVNSTLREYSVFAEQQSKSTTSASVKAFADNFDKTISALIKVQS